MFFTLQSRQLCIKSSEYYVWASLHKLCMCYYTVIWEKPKHFISNVSFWLFNHNKKLFFFLLSYLSFLFYFFPSSFSEWFICKLLCMSYKICPEEALLQNYFGVIVPLFFSSLFCFPWRSSHYRNLKATNSFQSFPCSTLLGFGHLAILSVLCASHIYHSLYNYSVWVGII